jgi:RNA polymerase sigma-70 factor (ECF subfamily)
MPAGPRAGTSDPGGLAARVELPRESAPRLAIAGVPHSDEADAFIELYEEHFDFVWRSVKRLGIAETSIDDAVQDVFVVAYRRLGEFEGRSSLHTWLFAIAMRVAKDFRRRERRKGGWLPLPSWLASRDRDPQGQCERTEMLAFVDRFLDSLDERQRIVFILAELEQMTAEEIALATGAKLNTVYSRLRLARDRFRRAVERFHKGEP